MQFTVDQLTKNITNVDISEILTCWRWKVADMKAVVSISCLGDIFFLGNDDNLYWLQTDTGDLTKIANSIEQYQQFLGDEEKIDNWFLPLFIGELQSAGKTLQENEVYSYIKPPVLGGEYSIDNIEVTDMSVHFAVTGQIYEQINDLPDGARVKIKFE
ncbi:T6SS immunity protein Tdi1 domain-containing protein [Paraflavitalea sp. CAU 1676]|uniref:T6SS immunity protein Tdi1 domain-containing protein n=1 Tax=Paraflavitalea sp. CAU 1676 TaxID=3032598 RepID=UPI0023DA46AB|nr:T6SS immunity protein Tdi1 domain-containing protein [Paraflavitalea sp. CAU 1676]MDF2188409.1 DUF1851 domain-containing protein [Paraflavitalea sp. CAU 1676]